MFWNHDRGKALSHISNRKRKNSVRRTSLAVSREVRGAGRTTHDL